MSARNRLLVAAAGALALLCAQAPAFADPPGWSDGYSDHGQDRDERDRNDRPHDNRDNAHERRDERHEERRDDRRDDRHEDRHDDRGDHGYRGYGSYGGYGGYGGYRGYGGDRWPRDYGVVGRGRCDTDGVMTVFGAVAGGIIGNRSASPANRGIATVFGAIAGGIIGNAVGSAIDDSDRACIGQSLELVPIGRPVVWRNPRSHIDWRMVPVRDVSRDCREFDLVRGPDGRNGHERVVACRRERGHWEFRGR